MENYKFSRNSMQVSKLTPFFKKLFKNKEYCPYIKEVTPVKIPTFEDIYMKILNNEDTNMPPISISTDTFETVIEYKVQHNPNIILNVQLTYNINVQPVTTTKYKLVKESAQLKISNGLSDCGGLLCSKPLIIETENEDLRWVVLETIKMCQDSNEDLLKQYQCY